jgi:hypothetical protein
MPHEIHIHVSPEDDSGASHITISFPREWDGFLGALIREARPDHDKRIDTIVATMKELLTMSSTISQQQDTNTGKIVADLDAIKTGIAGLQAQIAAGQGPAGSTITQAQEDALAAAAATADAMAATFTSTGTVAPVA